ncbi:hypothetical protein C8A05DRAFT_46979 [Staphylotrichum tortipilum]|uniref:Uncharacterized protein n=1 Tax=Staphylotrichum tortipilum TaxID=2831512 RepID=A0AAN6MET4_9PEZI|nr:hypothetical protein C8A05DRAFT_46979 [Staphylotrichum longicolle]
MAPDFETGKEPFRPLSLLGLPPHIRHRIYLHVGVARFDGYPYTYYLDGRKPLRGGTSEFDPPPGRNFAGLLLSCRALYAETAALLYSAHRFVIFYEHHGSLNPLRALSPAALASLTSLKIVLNQSSCHQPIDSLNYPPPCCCSERIGAHGSYCTDKFHRDAHRRPLLDPALDLKLASSAEVATQLMLSEWHETATYLSSSVAIGHLDLSLKEVTVSREHRGYQLCSPPCTNEFGCPPHIHHGCRLVECHSYVDSPLAGAPGRVPGCFCRRRHAAFSSTCRCWAPPPDLFLVCRALCRDAQFVFFSGNRFVVHDFDALMPWDLPDVRHYPYDRLFASEFLRDIIPAHCLADLRFVELVFPPYEPDGWPNSERAPILDWSDTIDWIQGKVNAPALTISVVMVDFHDGPDDVRRDLTKEQGTQIMQGYASVLYFLRSLARDDGLGGIHIQLAVPWRWAVGNIQWQSIWLANEEQRLRKDVEGFLLQVGGTVKRNCCPNNILRGIYYM